VQRRHLFAYLLKLKTFFTWFLITIPHTEILPLDNKEIIGTYSNHKITPNDHTTYEKVVVNKQYIKRNLIILSLQGYYNICKLWFFLKQNQREKKSELIYKSHHISDLWYFPSGFFLRAKFLPNWKKIRSWIL